MIKRTLYFGNPAYLSLRKEQMVIQLPEVEKNESLPDTFKKEATTTIPIEDIGVVILDNKQITIPITNGRLNLGTWQGIYFCEFRNHGGSRRLVITILG